MTRRISCYVVFATLIWSAHTQNEENVRDDMFKSNMTRNDFSKLLSSLIKLNEQRVSVLQKLYKLEDYGVLSEVLRSGDKKPENGNPNNLFLIVMSKNETAPSRRPLDIEFVDIVKSLDVESKKVPPKLDYVLDPASYISEITKKKTSMELFTNIPIDQRPKKTHLINDGSKKNVNTIKPLKYHEPRQNTEERNDTNILRNNKSGLKTNKKNKNHYENSKFEILSKEENGNTSEELQDYDDNSRKYSSVDNDDRPQHPEMFVTKIIETTNNNYKYLLRVKDRQDENDYGSPFSKEFTYKSSKAQDAKTGSDISIKKSKGNRNISILNNQAIRNTMIDTDIKSTTNKNDLRMTSTVKSDKTDTLSNRQNKKNHFGHKDKKDGYNYDSSSGTENEGKYTKIFSDISIKMGNDDKNPKPKINTDSPKIVQGNQNFQYNRTKSMLNSSSKYFTEMTEIKTTTNKNDLKIISPLNSSKTNAQHKDQEDESYYGSSFSKEYDDISQNHQIIEIDSPKIQDKQDPTPNAKNDTPISNTLNGVMETKNNYSEKPNLNIDLKQSKIEDDNASKVNDHSDKIPSQATKNPFEREIPVTLKVLPSKTDHDYPKDVGNDTDKYNATLAKDMLDGVNFDDKESKNNTNRDNKKILSHVMVVENIDGLTITTNPSLHLKDVTENTNKDKMKTTKYLENINKKNIKFKQHKKHDTETKFDESGELMIDKKNAQDFSIVITQVKKKKSEEINQPTNLRIDSKEFNQPNEKPIVRKAFQKCINKKAKKLCSKACISAYKNVCRRLKCTSKAKKALKNECKRSCKKTFASSSSKYSDESDDDDSDSYEDSDYSD